MKKQPIAGQVDGLKQVAPGGHGGGHGKIALGNGQGVAAIKQWGKAAGGGKLACNYGK